MPVLKNAENNAKTLLFYSSGYFCFYEIYFDNRKVVLVRHIVEEKENSCMYFLIYVLEIYHKLQNNLLDVGVYWSIK